MMTNFPFRRINVVGAPGSGTTTLGRALAARLGFGFADADDFYWKPTTPPYTDKYEVDFRLQSSLDFIANQEASVISGSVCGWGDALENSFDLIIFLSLPTPLRLERIEAREVERFGKAKPEFMRWAGQYDEGKLPGRSRQRHETWLATRQCIVTRFDTDQAIDQRIEHILDSFQARN
ncbi:AAA family ATPase [Methylobacillus gramineus]|uniref:AAA family ATPase n=1 Tax=Methylobacillus gramineus TaxID=755169 RepID=UPI001CFFF202|nr:AAA family ATPase [Methylobacillus gramineus]MCB5185326.1 AAA family ATPase [Methylobacillus gramineus]